MTLVADSNPGSSGNSKRADKLFEKAKTVAETGNYDYAIELYLQGLAEGPDNVPVHAEVRRISLTRKATGGKALGMLKSMGIKTNSKDQQQNMLNAEKLLAYDPGNIGHMTSMVKAAAAGGFVKAVVWIGPILTRVNLEGKKDPAVFNLLKDLYQQVEEYQLALDALQLAAASQPDNGDLQHELRELATRLAIKKGQYEKGDFRESMRDAEGQRARLEEDTDVRTVDAMQGQIARARHDYEASGRDPAKIGKLVETLVKTADLKYENEAIDLLEGTYKATKSYRYKFQAEEIKLRQLTRTERNMRAQLAEEPDNADLKEMVEELAHDRVEGELKHYQQAMRAYPTDMKLKFEVGKRFFLLEQFDEAIPMLQQSSNDAKLREEAGVLLGRSFLQAGYVPEAVETLKGRIDSYTIEGDDKSKMMYYWYGRALEQNENLEEATKAYSQIAQWDFGYRDVQTRIKELRAKK